MRWKRVDPILALAAGAVVLAAAAVSAAAPKEPAGSPSKSAGWRIGGYSDWSRIKSMRGSRRSIISQCCSASGVATTTRRRLERCVIDIAFHRRFLSLGSNI